MKEYSEKKLLLLIKKIPNVIILFFLVIVMIFTIIYNINKNSNSIEIYKNDLINEKKIKIKSEVLKLTEQIKYQENLSLKNLRKKLKHKADMVYKIIENIYKENRNLTKWQITKLIKDAIRAIRYDDGRGYFFIYDMNGTNILLPPSPHLEGTNMLELQDKKGLYMIKEAIKIAKYETEGYLKWHWYKPNESTNMKEKLGFIRYIHELDMFLGIGDYIEDFTTDLKHVLIKEVKNINKNNKEYIFIYKNNKPILNAMDELNSDTYSLSNDKINKYVSYKINNVINKTSYVSYVELWDWTVGKGFNVDEINKIVNIKRTKLDISLYQTMGFIFLIYIFMASVFLFFVRIFVSKIRKIFIDYKSTLNKHIKKNKHKDKLIFENIKMNSLKDMIDNIAHQWRQPLSIVLTSSSNIQLNIQNEDINIQNIEKSCEIINKNTELLSKTIEEFSTFIHDDMEKRYFSIKDAINKLKSLTNTMMTKNSILFINDVNIKSRIDGYENELIKSIVNLFNNSQEAFVDNKIENRLIIISCEENDNNIMLKIKDNAGGITKNIVNMIFEPYFTTKHQTQGKGLGLHGIHDVIVNTMKGNIEFENETFVYDGKSQKGSVFIITLPKN